MSSIRIKQAVGYVTLSTGNKFHIRISRRGFSDLVRYWQRYPHFKYMKIYEIVDYKKGSKHRLGNKIAYITLNGSALDYNGLKESVSSQNWLKKTFC